MYNHILHLTRHPCFKTPHINPTNVPNKHILNSVLRIRNTERTIYTTNVVCNLQVNQPFKPTQIQTLWHTVFQTNVRSFNTVTEC